MPVHSASDEDYLETIIRLRNETGEVRASAISQRLGVRKPSVTEAIKKLNGEGASEVRSD
jgi:Mn-dependent DtxR family transcriptional regulator